jgi:hypothetical protein
MGPAGSGNRGGVVAAQEGPDDGTRWTLASIWQGDPSAVHWQCGPPASAEENLP